MVAYIPRLDTKAMGWERSSALTGLFTKKLLENPATGARTYLQRLVPSEGALPPQVAHYHQTFEELFVIQGRMSFDSETWLTPYSYCWHPPGTVHGFKSSVPEETWFISRVGEPLQFTYVENPPQKKPYAVDGRPPARSCAYHAAAQDLPGWEPVKNAGGEVTASRYILSLDPETGAGSFIQRYRPGWVSSETHAFSDMAEEIFVLEGAIECDDGRHLDAGCYAATPANWPRRRWRSPEGALAYVTRLKESG
jgi:glyoxylate utilization-related uncharacterized protein